jgi:hypothetical protein
MNGGASTTAGGARGPPGANGALRALVRIGAKSVAANEEIEGADVFAYEGDA